MTERLHFHFSPGGQVGAGLRDPGLIHEMMGLGRNLEVVK